MSFGYKLRYFAIGGVLIALSWANGCQAQSNSYPMTEQREDHAASTDGYASPNCESPKSAEEANFCEQRRSAAAAEQQAIWGREQALWARTQTWLSAGQVVLGIVGLVAVVVTLIYVWGHIRYADFMNGVAETGFVAFQYPEMRAGPHLIQTAAFRFRGPPAYTYHRYREDGSDPS
jgi:hypothetical protein